MEEGEADEAEACVERTLIRGAVAGARKSRRTVFLVASMGTMPSSRPVCKHTDHIHVQMMAG